MALFPVSGVAAGQLHGQVRVEKKPYFPDGNRAVPPKGERRSRVLRGGDPGLGPPPGAAACRKNGGGGIKGNLFIPYPGLEAEGTAGLSTEKADPFPLAKPQEDSGSRGKAQL